LRELVGDGSSDVCPSDLVAALVASMTTQPTPRALPADGSRPVDRQGAFPPPLPGKAGKFTPPRVASRGPCTGTLELDVLGSPARSEERRVGKEGGGRRAP